MITLFFGILAVGFLVCLIVTGEQIASLAAISRLKTPQGYELSDIEDLTFNKGQKGPSAKEMKESEKRQAKMYKDMQKSFEMPEISMPALKIPDMPTPPKPEPVAPPATENKREAEQAADDKNKQARRRRGLLSSIKAGETAAPASGKKTLLG